MQEFLEASELERLAAFVAVAESGSFTDAARKLGRDASIVSRRVSQLEQRLGVRLLSRTTRRLSLTEVKALTSRKLASYRYLVVAAPSYLASHGTPRTPEDLRKHACHFAYGRLAGGPCGARG